MPDVHVSRRLLEAVAHGRLSARWLRVYYAQHARELGAFRDSAASVCPVEPSLPPPARLPRAAYTAVTQRVLRHAVTIERTLANADGTAARVEAELIALPAAERAACLRRAAPGPWALQLADRLLERARPRAGGNLVHAQEWAALARDCALWLAHAEPRIPAALRSEIEVLAVAFDAHAHCLAGNLVAADEGFALVQSAAHRVGWLDPVVQAELHVLEAGLRRAQRRWPVAERLYRRAASLLHQVDAPAEAALVEVRLASLLRHTGRREEAATVLHQALGQLRPALVAAASTSSEARTEGVAPEVRWLPHPGQRLTPQRRLNR